MISTFIEHGETRKRIFSMIHHEILFPCTITIVTLCERRKRIFLIYRLAKEKVDGVERIKLERDGVIRASVFPALVANARVTHLTREYLVQNLLYRRIYFESILLL